MQKMKLTHKETGAVIYVRLHPTHRELRYSSRVVSYGFAVRTFKNSGYTHPKWS